MAFFIGQLVICIDDLDSGHRLSTHYKNLLKYKQVYIVADVNDCFVVVEGLDGSSIVGEWHETRFIDWKEV